MKLQATALFCLALCCPASAAPPTAAQLLRMRLGDGFTLVYQVTVRDLRSPSLRAKQMADQRRGVGEEIAAGHIPKQMADYYEKQTLSIGRPSPTEQFILTVSARDGRLLYLSTRGAKNQKDGTKMAIILDGDKEYEATGKTAGMINKDGGRGGTLYKSENVDRLAFCPLPGVGLPGVDLIQSPVQAGLMPGGRTRFTGLVPRLNLIDGDSPYRAGGVEAILKQGRLQVVSLTVGPPAAPEQTWKMTAFRLVQGHWVASAMSMVASEETAPTSEAAYQLTEARPAALEAEAFEVGTYLAKGAEVFDGSGSSSFTFSYDPDGGALKEQAAAARDREAAAKISK